MVARCCDAKVAEDHRDGAEFENVLQRWLHYAFVPPYKVQSHMHMLYMHMHMHMCMHM